MPSYHVSGTLTLELDTTIDASDEQAALDAAIDEMGTAGNLIATDLKVEEDIPW